MRQTHDANGNLSGDGTWTYGYDLNNRLKTASKVGTSATLAYDAEGRLRQSVIAATTTNLTYDGQDLVAEYDAAGALQRRYVHGPGVDEPLLVYEGTTTTAKTWLYADHLGSIVGTADSTGTSTATYSYGPYGEPNTLTGQRFRYTGQQLISGLGLYYYKARFYSPALGRFLQTDPIGTVDDLNLYAYVGNSPVNFTDPSRLSRAEAVQLACGGAMACASMALEVISKTMDEWTGGYGARLSESVAAGNYGAAGANLAAGVAFGAMNTISGGTGGALAKGGVAVTDDAIRAALSGSDLLTSQGAISRPVIEKYVRRLEAGEVAPAIKVDGKVIVDGNHRYIAGRLTGKKPARTAGTLAASQTGKVQPVSNLKIDPSDWGNR